MSFVDDLKSYNREAEQRKKEALNIGRFINEIVQRAVEGVKYSAWYMATQGGHSINGYLNFWPDDRGCYNDYVGLSAGGKFMITSNAVDWVILIDRMPTGSRKTSAWHCSQQRVDCREIMIYISESDDTLMLPEQTADSICAAVRKEMEKLGFQSYLVLPKKTNFYKKQAKPAKKKKKSSFITYTYDKPQVEYEYPLYKTATLLWIEANW